MNEAKTETEKPRLGNTNCSVRGCRSRRSRAEDRNVHFHTFPKKGSGFVYITNVLGIVERIDRRTAWETILKYDRPVGPYMLVCSRHFLPTDYFLPDLKGPESRMKLKRTAVPSQKLPEDTYPIEPVACRRLLIPGQVLQRSCAFVSVENEISEMPWDSGCHEVPVEEQEVVIKQDFDENFEQAEDPLSLDIKHSVVVKSEDGDQEPCDEAGPAATDTIFLNDSESSPEATNNNINYSIKLKKGYTLGPELLKYFGPNALDLPKRGRPSKEKENKRKFEDFSEEDMQDPRRAAEFYSLATSLVQRNKLLHENILFSARIDKLESEIDHMKRRIVDCDNDQCHRWKTLQPTKSGRPNFRSAATKSTNNKP